MNDVSYHALLVRIRHRRTVLRFVRFVEFLVMCCSPLRVGNIHKPFGALLQLGIMVVQGVLLRMYLDRAIKARLTRPILRLYRRMPSKKALIRRALGRRHACIVAFLYTHRQQLYPPCAAAFEEIFADNHWGPIAHKILQHADDNRVVAPEEKQSGCCANTFGFVP